MGGGGQGVAFLHKDSLTQFRFSECVLAVWTGFVPSHSGANPRPAAESNPPRQINHKRPFALQTSHIPDKSLREQLFPGRGVFLFFFFSLRLPSPALFFFSLLLLPALEVEEQLC